MSIFKVLFEAFGRFIYALLRPVGYLIKVVFQFSKRLIHALITAFTWLALKIALAIRLISLKLYRYLLRPIGIFIKMVVVTIFRIIKSVIKWLWQYIFKYIYLFFKIITTSIYQFLTFVTRHVVIFLKRVSAYLVHILSALLLFIYKRIIHPIYLFFKFIVKKIYRFIYPIVCVILKGFWSIIQYVSQGVYYILKWIWLCIYHTLTWLIKNLYLVIRTVVIALYKAIKWCYGRIIDVTIYIFSAIKYGFKSLQEPLYQSIINGYVFIYLLLYGLVTVLFKYILYKTPIWLFTRIGKILNHLSQWMTTLFAHIKRIFMKLTYHIKRLFLPIKVSLLDKIFDIKQYYFMILLAPIVIPIFMAVFIVALAHLVVVWVFIVLKTIIGYQKAEPHDLVFVKKAYLPSRDIFSNAYAYLWKMKYVYSVSSKLKGAYYLIVILIWQLVFLIPMSLGIAILLAPLTAVSVLLHALIYFILRIQGDLESHVLKQVVINPNPTGALFIHASNRYFQKITVEVITSHFIDSETKAYVFDNHVGQLDLIVTIALKPTQYRMTYTNTTKGVLLYQMAFIRQYIQNQTIDGFALMYEDTYDIKYELTHQKDSISDGVFSIRSYAYKSNIHVSITMDNETVEDLMPVRVISQQNVYVMLNQTLELKKHDHLLYVLDPKYDYTFEKSSTIDHTGKILFASEQFEKVTIQINQHPIPYALDLYVQGEEKTLKHMIKSLESSISIDETHLKLPSHIENSDLTVRDVSWYIQLSGIDAPSAIDLSRFGIKRVYQALAVFKFNDRVIEKVFNVAYPFYEKAMFNQSFKAIIQQYPFILDETKDIFEQYEKRYKNAVKGKTFIKLKTHASGFVKCITWVSLDSKSIQSSGKVLVNKDTKFRVTLHHSLFKKQTFEVTITP